MVEVCNKCFKVKCLCNDRKDIEIDDLMVDTIRILNEKGYKTLFCCSGHYDPNNDYKRQIYILFDRALLFDNFDYYKIDTKYSYDIKYSGAYVAIRTSLEFKPLKNIVDDKEVYIKEVNNDLYNWALKIPSIKEHKESIDYISYFKQDSLTYSRYKYHREDV